MHTRSKSEGIPTPVGDFKYDESPMRQARKAQTPGPKQKGRRSQSVKAPPPKSESAPSLPDDPPSVRKGPRPLTVKEHVKNIESGKRVQTRLSLLQAQEAKWVEATPINERNRNRAGDKAYNVVADPNNSEEDSMIPLVASGNKSQTDVPASSVGFANDENNKSDDDDVKPAAVVKKGLGKEEEEVPALTSKSNSVSAIAVVSDFEGHKNSSESGTRTEVQHSVVPSAKKSDDFIVDTRMQQKEHTTLINVDNVAEEKVTATATTTDAKEEVKDLVAATDEENRSNDEEESLDEDKIKTQKYEFQKLLHPSLLSDTNEAIDDATPSKKAVLNVSAQTDRATHDLLGQESQVQQQNPTEQNSHEAELKKGPNSEQQFKHHSNKVKFSGIPSKEEIGKQGSVFKEDLKELEKPIVKKVEEVEKSIKEDLCSVITEKISSIEESMKKQRSGFKEDLEHTKESIIEEVGQAAEAQLNSSITGLKSSLKVEIAALKTELNWFESSIVEKVGTSVENKLQLLLEEKATKQTDDTNKNIEAQTQTPEEWLQGPSRDWLRALRDGLECCFGLKA